jgi:integrase
VLTDTELKALRPREKAYKRSDERGLYVIVTEDGALWWRFRYRYGGREKLISLGTYPDTSLKLARQKRDDARQDLARGVDPSARRQAEKVAQADSFEAVAREWLALQKSKLAEITIEKATWALETFVFPHIGGKPVGQVDPADVLKLLRRIEARGKHETAHRTRQRCSQVFRFAVASGRAARDPTADLKGALAPVKTESHAAITEPKRIGELLRAIDGYQGQPSVMAALKLAPLVFVRPGELRAAAWNEFDLEEAEWRIPAARMKIDDAHVVPLSAQAIAVLEELHTVTGRGVLLFPSLTSKEWPISENTLNAALRRLGYAGNEMTAHGFRAMASTRLNEMGFPPDVIELQLAHKERNKVRAAYNRAERLAERRKLMQAWADYLDGLRQGADVKAIREA